MSFSEKGPKMAFLGKWPKMPKMPKMPILGYTQKLRFCDCEVWHPRKAQSDNLNLTYSWESFLYFLLISEKHWKTITYISHWFSVNFIFNFSIKVEESGTEWVIWVFGCPNW
jgi:hypothetical protein